MMTPKKRIAALVSAQNADWQQVALNCLNGGEPCFHIDLNAERFCLRAESWAGHDSHHVFVSLRSLLREYQVVKP